MIRTERRTDMAKIHSLPLQRATRETQAEKGCYQQEGLKQFRGRGKAKSSEIRLTVYYMTKAGLEPIHFFI